MVSPVMKRSNGAAWKAGAHHKDTKITKNG